MPILNIGDIIYKRDTTYEWKLKFKAGLTLFIFFCFCAASLAIEDIAKISLDEAINIAIQNSIDLQAQKINVDIAKNSIKAANRLQNPSLDTYWNMGEAGAGNPHSIGISQVIELFKRKHRKKSAQASYAVSEESAKYKNFDLKMDVREAYINLVSAKSIVDSLEMEEKSLTEINRIVKQRYKSGKASETDVIQADISLNHVRTQLNTARTNIMAARFEFNSVMDTDPIYDSIIETFDDDKNFSALLTPSPKSPLPGFSDILALAEQHRFDLKIAQKEIDVAKNNLKIATSQRVPDVEISAGYLFQPMGVSSEGRYLNGAYIGAGLVNLPILYNYSPEIKNAKLEIEKAELKYAAVQNNAFANLSSAYEKLVNARVNLNYYTDSLIEDSIHMMKTSKKNYEEGKTNDLTSLIVIEQSFRSIIIGYTYALAQYYSCYINFLREVDVDNLDSITNSSVPL